MLQSSYVLKDRLYLLRSLAPLKRNLFYITKIRKVFPKQETTQISFKLVTELKKFSVPRKHTNVAAKGQESIPAWPLNSTRSSM